MVDDQMLPNFLRRFRDQISMVIGKKFRVFGEGEERRPNMEGFRSNCQIWNPMATMATLSRPQPAAARIFVVAAAIIFCSVAFFASKPLLRGPGPRLQVKTRGGFGSPAMGLKTASSMSMQRSPVSFDGTSFASNRQHAPAIFPSRDSPLQLDRSMRRN